MNSYLETRNVPMALQAFQRLLDYVEHQSILSEKMEIYATLIDGLHKIGQSELANKYKRKALSQNSQF